MGLTLAQQERELLQRIPAKELRDRLFALVAAIFTTLASDCPTVLTIEDLHWADTASHELLEHLYPLAERLLLAIAMVPRPEPNRSRSPLTARERHGAIFTDLVLAPLTEAGTVEMALRLLSLDEMPASLRGFVVRRAERNPFYVEEMIRTLIEQGALVRAGEGGWAAGAEIGRVVVPETLHGLLMARLDRFPPETRQLAQRASVIGLIFLYRVLRRMSEDERGIDEGLGRMREAFGCFQRVLTEATGLDDPELLGIPSFLVHRQRVHHTGAAREGAKAARAGPRGAGEDRQLVLLGARAGGKGPDRPTEHQDQ